MTTENVAAEGVTNEAAAAEEAAFLAEMAQEIGADEGSPAPALEEPVAKADESAPAEPPAEPAQAERKEVFAGMTAEELTEKLGKIDQLQKAIDTTNGTYGARLAELQKGIDQLAQQRQTMGGMSKDKLKRLSAEFPELAELLAEDLSEIVGQGGGQNFDPEQFAQTTQNIVEERVRKAEQAMEVRELTRRHSDWQKVATFTVTPQGAVVWNNPDFGGFVATLPADEQEKLLTVFDADFVGEKIAQFKEKIATVAPPPKQDKSKELAAAVLPSGTGARSAPNPLDEEEAAFRAEMARG